MIAMSSADLVELFPQRDASEFNFHFKSVETDSRKPCKGALFIALKGDHFDGHDYLRQATEQGAVAALVEQKNDAIDIPQIVVEDSLQAMAKLANKWRKIVNPTVIAITGSNGKTTVKEMLARILEANAQVLKTPGNFNNAIGVPLTLFALSKSDDFAIVEMGANHRYEIEQLQKIAEPDIVYVNNAREAHLQGFGNLQGVIQAKGEMYQYARPESVAVFNEDEDASEYWKSIAASQSHLGF
jgi:UDP-N-acetylmuramoyl-tripeptide--D-alanyl-D-alanine ligase